MLQEYSVGNVIYPQYQGQLPQPSGVLAEMRQMRSCLWQGPWWWGGWGGPQKAEYCCSSECYGSGNHIFRAQRNFKYKLIQCLGCSSVDTHGGDIYAHSEALQSLVKVFDFDFTAG